MEIGVWPRASPSENLICPRLAEVCKIIDEITGFLRSNEDEEKRIEMNGTGRWNGAKKESLAEIANLIRDADVVQTISLVFLLRLPMALEVLE